MKMLIAGLLAVFALSVTMLAASVVVHADDMEGMDMGGGSSSGNAMSAMGGHLDMGAHMTMTELRPQTAADVERGQFIIKTMRDKLSKYQDYKVALGDGYQPYLPDASGPVVHFANHDATAAEYLGDFDIARPGSLLYEKTTFGGWKLVGAMYDAPESDTPAQLDKLIPLSLVRWHAHTNICLPNGINEQDVIKGNSGSHMRPDITSAHGGIGGRGSSDNAGARMRFGYMADTRFGFDGTISNQADCEAAGGNFHPQIFAWMVHVYPFASEDPKVAFSMDAP